MQLNPSDFYSYFKECYKLDYREFAVDNVLSRKYPYKWFVPDKEELLGESLPYIPYPNGNSDDLEKEIELYKLEKKLFYACFFVLGKNLNPLIKDKRICAPLVLFPANILKVHGERFLEIEKHSCIINRSALTSLELKDESKSKDLFITELTDLLETRSKNLILLKSLIDRYFLNLDSDELLLYPKVWPMAKLRNHLQESKYGEGAYKIVPAAGTVLVDKSESTLKVLNDLNEIIGRGTFNSSLSDLLTEQVAEFPFSQSVFKSKLNEDQAKALENAYRFTNSVVVGPPGTGKSYTITTIISDLVTNDQSVLVVSKTKQAVEVLRTMLEDDFGLKDYLIHTTGNKYKVSLKAKVKRYLSGMLSSRRAVSNETKVLGFYERLQSLEEQFKKLIDMELRKSELEFGSDLSFFEKLEKLYLGSPFFRTDEIWLVFDDIENTLRHLEKEISTYSRRKIQRNIRENSMAFRQDIALFHDALDASSFTEYKATLSKVNQRNILKVFPVWLANLSDLNSVLPLEKDLFDVVVIDEATQCDISIALPAIYRARRAVVVGDPNQLRHYSFVSKAQQRNLQGRFSLPNDKIFDYRNRSILDVFISKLSSQQQVSFLREHFRSTPSLIEFSNQQFYEGQLEVIKSTPSHTNHNQIELIEVKGERDSNGINRVEAEAVMYKLQELIDQYNHSGSIPSIGVISPFSSQVNYINRLLRERFELGILKRHNLLCGTPYNFQGSEREIVLLSFGVCDHTHPSAYNHASKPEVLNVAITRAKSYQYVFKSVSDSFTKKDNLLFDYFRFIKSFSHAGSAEPEKDRFQQDVVDELSRCGLDEIKCGYPVAGSLLDILITTNGRNYFIDLIGYPGPFREAFSLERYKTLGRTGIKCFPLHYSYWKQNKKAAIERIQRFIKRL
jgi:hypothetical protein